MAFPTPLIIPRIIPWEPSHIPVEIQDEFARRRQNISLNYVSSQGTWKSGDWKKYTGPMTAWARMCSNGLGPGSPRYTNEQLQKLKEEGKPPPKIEYLKQRFVFFGGKDFPSTYGFKSTNTTPNTQVIGYMPNGDPHIINNDINSDYPIHVPAPEITRIEMIIQKELLRRATVEWTCFSWKQLEYMTPYFLVPGISVMIEIGWNHFNPTSLVDIADLQKMKDLWENPYPLYQQNIIESNGNYDVIYGLVTNFNWSVEGNNKYICSTEITSPNRLYAGLPIRSEMFLRQKEVEANTTRDKTLGNLSEFIGAGQTIDTFVDISKYGTAGLSKKGIYKQITKKTDTLPTITSATAQSAGAMAIAQFAFPKTETSVELTPVPDFFKNLYDQILSIPDKQVKNLKLSYLYGVFNGRSEEEIKNAGNSDDFDTKRNTKHIWFNMGLMSLILNSFSNRPGSTDKKQMFELDIDDVLISAHPNLISSDGGVMIIPNTESPKYFWGSARRAGGYRKLSEKYVNQYRNPIRNSKRKSDIILKNLFNQPDPVRDDLDVWINRNVYRLNPEAGTNEDPEYSKPNRGDRSFPQKEKDDIKSFGYLRDVYINIDLLKKAVKDEKIVSYYDLVSFIIKKLNETSAGLWDLQLFDNGNGRWTIADSNFVSSRNSQIQPKVMVFDMHDVNNIVKSFRFRPQLTDTQATRVIYSTMENPNDSYSSREEIESLSYGYKDSVLKRPDNTTTQPATTRDKETWELILDNLQRLDNDVDQTFQMGIRRSYYDSNNNKFRPNPPKETTEFQAMLYIKLALPTGGVDALSILKKMLDDQDYDNNPKYCAIQPGINAEITLQGIGGLRTFQCFLIRNLPEPYSHRNIIFQIINIMDHVESGNWETTIVAGIRPLRNYIINALRIRDEIR